MDRELITFCAVNVVCISSNSEAYFTNATLRQFWRICCKAGRDETGENLERNAKKSLKYRQAANAYGKYAKPCNNF